MEELKRMRARAKDLLIPAKVKIAERSLDRPHVYRMRLFHSDTRCPSFWLDLWRLPLPMVKK